MDKFDYWKLAEEDVPPRRLHADPDDEDIEEEEEDDEDE